METITPSFTFELNSADIDADGRLLLHGRGSGNAEIFGAELSLEGGNFVIATPGEGSMPSALWLGNLGFGGAASTGVLPLASRWTGEAEVVVGGQVVGPTSMDGRSIDTEGRDAVLIRWRPGGGTVWARVFGGSGDDDTIYDVAAMEDGDLLVVGHLGPGGDLRDDAVETAAGRGFAARFDPAGRLRWQHLSARDGPLQRVAAGDDAVVAIAQRSARDAAVVSLDP